MSEQKKKINHSLTFHFVMRQLSLSIWWIVDDFKNKIINMLVKSVGIESVCDFWFKSCTTQKIASYWINGQNILRYWGWYINWNIFTRIIPARNSIRPFKRLINLNDTIVLILFFVFNSKMKREKKCCVANKQIFAFACVWKASFRFIHSSFALNRIWIVVFHLLCHQN